MAKKKNAEKALAQSELDQDELDQRVAILRRFRELLTAQRDRFRDYLDVLEKQKDVIEKGDENALLSHVELEEKIVADIFAIQKVVDPLEEMYRAAYPEREREIPQIKASLEEMKAEVIERSARNRALLSTRMEELRTEIRTLRNNPFLQRKSVYDNGGSASLVDIKG